VLLAGRAPLHICAYKHRGNCRIAAAQFLNSGKPRDGYCRIHFILAASAVQFFIRSVVFESFSLFLGLVADKGSGILGSSKLILDSAHPGYVRAFWPLVSFLALVLALFLCKGPHL
jgi:hypothetical protein